MLCLRAQAGHSPAVQSGPSTKPAGLLSLGHHLTLHSALNQNTDKPPAERAPCLNSHRRPLNLPHSNTGKLLNYRRSLRLAAKNKGPRKTSLQKAQALMCKKVKMANLASNGQSSAAQSFLLQASGRMMNCDTVLKRDQELPLTSKEIQLIKAICGISEEAGGLTEAIGNSGPIDARVNRNVRFLTWNVRGLHDLSKCLVVKSFIRNCKCCVVCLQETKLSSTSVDKFRSFCGFHLPDFRTRDADGTRGGLLTAWNSSLFDCVQEWKGSFSLTVLLKRRVDGATFMISNVYGPTTASLRADFFLELRSFSNFTSGAWTMVGDFNVLLSVDDKNGPTSNIADILKFREVVHDLGLVDLPILNKAFT
uniref:Endonuclease/exonuclease/phosphatase domain-containing protein n=1 Tax=Ananas comosus var. bracteatus TaxID=296719 RepID=A0A6V7NI42_ANACO|nr:unnamed protein product [Ananas comosus var. bracteatus]